MNGNGVIRSGYPFGWGAYESTLVRGDGMYVFDQNGKRYLDLCSGLWNMPLGYSERRIKAVVNKQMEQLPFSNLLVFSSDIQTQYAQRLLQWMGDFGCILYTCSGSETVEAAIKTCRQYQCLRNRPEHRRIAAFTLSYHGTSYGVMSVSGIDQILTDVYRPLVPEISWVTVPADYADEDAWRQAINGLWEREGDYLAGFIVEPVMASGRVVPVPNPVLQHIQQRCRERDVLLVADEVATGFGRTGTPFAWQQAEITPDLVCLSKAINNGYLAEERGMFPKETVQSQLLFLARLKGMSAKAADQSIQRWLERLEIPQYQKSKLESLSKGNPTFHDVLQKLVDAQVPVDALERSQESLQEIFLNLVGEEGVEA